MTTAKSYDEDAYVAAQTPEEGDGISPATEQALDEGGLGSMVTPRVLLFGLLGIVAAIVGLYVLLPKLVGVDHALEEIGHATWYWLVVGVGMVLLSFVSYAAVFRGVIGGGQNDPKVTERLDMGTSWQITRAAFAATTFFSAAGAGGLIVVYWALRKAGMEARRAACRMVALLVLLYAFYALALMLFGILLRTQVLPGSAPWAGTIVPAGIAAILVLVALCVALIPEDFERRLEGLKDARRFRRLARLAQKMAKVPATLATGVRTAIARVRNPRTAWLVILGGILYWGGNIGVLWASFHAFGVEVPFAVVVQGFFVGMAANLIPSPAAGAGPVDAGMIAAFLLFDIPKESVFPAVLTYRLIAFWLPTIPGIVAWFQLRRTVDGWQREDRAAGGYTSVSKVMEAEVS